MPGKTAQPAGASGEIEMAAEPSLLRLGSDLGATLRIVAGAGATDMRVTASVGSVAHVRAVGDGVFAADYVPPEDSIPQVAIISAVARAPGGTRWGWLAIPLWGEGDAVVKTRPFASISVQIGAQTFGPEKANASGIALVRVVVPPGVREAWHGRRAVDLHVPPTPTLHVALDRVSAPADRGEQVPVRVYLFTTQGVPRSDAQIELRASRGTVSALSSPRAGVYEARWSLPPGPAGRERLTAVLREAPDLRSTAALEREPGPPAAIELSADRESIVAGAGVDVVLRARARDAAGNVSLDPLEISTPEGFGAPVEARPGEWRLRPPDSFGGRQSLEVVAHPRGSSEPHASTSLRLLPGQPASASIEPGSPAVRIGPSGRLQLRVLQTDRFGNLVPGPAPAATAQEGSIGAVERQPDGAYLATYRPPHHWDREDTVVDVRWPEASARTRVLLLPRLATLAISPKAGVLSNFARLTSPLAALEASLRTDRFGPQLAFSTELAWYFSSTQQDAGPLGTAQGRVDFFALSAQLAFRFPIGIRTTVWAGAGPSFEALASRVKVGAEPQVSESTIVVGAAVSIGVERRFASTVPFAELRWSRHRDPSLSTLTGAISATSLVLGTRFELL